MEVSAEGFAPKRVPLEVASTLGANILVDVVYSLTGVVPNMVGFVSDVVGAPNTDPGLLDVAGAPNNDPDFSDVA